MCAELFTSSPKLSKKSSCPVQQNVEIKGYTQISNRKKGLSPFNQSLFSIRNLYGFINIYIRGVVYIL